MPPIALQMWFFALAAVVIRFSDLQTMAWDSDVVVHAIATDRYSAEEADGRLVTWTELTVVDARSHRESSYAVEQPEVLWLAQPGGQLNGRVTMVPGSARLEIGEQCVLFAMDMLNWPGVVIPHTHGGGLMVVDSLDGGLVERVGNVSTLAGGTPEPRSIDSMDTFWGQIGLPRTQR